MGTYIGRSINYGSFNFSNFADTLVGSNSADIINGLGGNDHLYGEFGNDTIIGGDGDDYIAPTSGTWQAHWGNDYVYGGAGVDTIDYTLSQDRVVAYGGDNGDFLFGGSGNDALLGDNGMDFIDGGAGADWIEGGAGGDWLRGGANNDWFALSAGNSTIWDPDVIQDFSEFAGDRIDAAVAGTQYNTNIDQTSYSSALTAADAARLDIANHSHTYFIAYAPGAAYLFADLNGDRQVDSEMVLTGVAPGSLHYWDII